MFLQPWFVSARNNIFRFVTTQTDANEKDSAMVRVRTKQNISVRDDTNRAIFSHGS